MYPSVLPYGPVCLHVCFLRVLQQTCIKYKKQAKHHKLSYTVLFSVLAQLLRYMQTTLCGHEAGTVAMTTQLRNGIINEVERFAGLPLQMLRLTQLDR